jgi:hypothetical protein
VILTLENFRYYYLYRDFFQNLSIRALQDILLKFLDSGNIVEKIKIHWYPNIPESKQTRLMSTIKDLDQLISRIAEDLDMPNLTFMEILYNSPMSRSRYVSYHNGPSLLTLDAPKPAWWTAKFPRTYNK